MICSNHYNKHIQGMHFCKYLVAIFHNDVIWHSNIEYDLGKIKRRNYEVIRFQHTQVTENLFYPITDTTN